MSTSEKRTPVVSEEHIDMITDETPKTIPEEPQTKGDIEAPLPEGETGENSQLPEGVTEEPQSPEHLDLRKVKATDRKWLRTYLRVSDDEGHLLADQPLENRVIKTCSELSLTEIEKIDDPESLLRGLRELSVLYATSINVAENSSVGTLTKYRIRLGTLLLFQRRIVLDRLKKEWVDWFQANYDKRQLRSCQDFMRLATYPKAINYAFLGKERLMQISRLIGKNPEGNDPIGDYLKQAGLEFDPMEATDYEEIKTQTDAAIFKKKLLDKGIDELPDDKIAAMVRKGIDPKPARIEQFKIVKDSGGDLSGYADRLITTGGKVEAIVTPEKKAESFKKMLDRFLDQAESAIGDDAYLGQLDAESLNRLREKIEALAAKLESRSS